MHFGIGIHTYIHTLHDLVELGGEDGRGGDGDGERGENKDVKGG